MANEMAHYAADCWDAEIQSSYGWVECVGCADRSAYDLTVHSVKTGTKLVVREMLDEPIVEEKLVPVLDKKKSGPIFKKEQQLIEGTIMALDQERLACVQAELEQKKYVSIHIRYRALRSPDRTTSIRLPEGRDIDVPADVLSVVRRTFKESSELSSTSYFTKADRCIAREFTPNVIEPSFGIGRVLYSLLEHSYWTRAESEARSVCITPLF